MNYKSIIKLRCLITMLLLVSIDSYAGLSPYRLSIEKRPLTTIEKSVIIDATKVFFGNEYKDQFDSLKFIWPDYNGNKYGGYCGLVNIENNDGKYLGYNPFILYFYKDENQKLVVRYTGTVKADDLYLREDFFSICKNKEQLKYDLEPLLNRQE